jgi:hypothetical protein
MDDEFVKQRARLIRELADKGRSVHQKTADGLGEKLRRQDRASLSGDRYSSL